MKFANKNNHIRTEIRLIDFDFHEELKKPKNKLLNLSLILEKLVFALESSIKYFSNKQ